MLLSAEDFLATARTALGRGAALRFRAQGRSMRPFVRDGDHVTIQGTKAIRRGDVILYENAGGQAVLHRVLRVASRDAWGAVDLIVAGDAETRQCDRVSRAMVLGRAVKIERDGRVLDPARQRPLALAWQVLRLPRQKWARLASLLRGQASA